MYAAMMVPATVANPPVMTAWSSDSVSLYQNGRSTTLDSTWGANNPTFIALQGHSCLCVIICYTLVCYVCYVYSSI